MRYVLPNYLGSPATAILEVEPFKHWPVEKTFDDDLEPPRIGFIFSRHGIELSCDLDETINTIFLNSDDFVRFDESLLNLSFSSNRQQVLQRMGCPAKSGGPISDPVLGEFGPWDRFARPGYAIHFAYRPGADGILRITLMRSDVVP